MSSYFMPDSPETLINELTSANYFTLRRH